FSSLGTDDAADTSNLVNDILVKKGYKVLFNPGGANGEAGHIVNLLKGVNIFNHCSADASVLEVDELSIDRTMPMVKPDYLIVTNLSKDNIKYGHPENIFSHMNRCFELLSDKTTAVLNANDPISSNLGGNVKKVFCSIADLGLHPYENRSKDISYCPRCRGEIEYSYRLYRFIGKYHCKSCDFGTHEADFEAKTVDLKNLTMTINDEADVRLISDSIFNAYNVLYVYALFRTMGDDSETVKNALNNVKMPKIRESVVEYNGIKYYAMASKGQNGSSSSNVFEYMHNEPSKKDIVLFLDELQDWRHPPETISWLYETDYELLKSDNIHKIIVGGHMYLNHKLRMLLAGVHEEKIVAFENKEDIPKYVSREGIEKVYVLFDVDFQFEAPVLRDQIVEYAKEAQNEKN
ncbi:MAG: MurT ligase domain-containing protein, partial [Clostridia bacterium]|nr:MurT ligase domain-containing protein [Clostridia bacterium]